jgi:amidase
VTALDLVATDATEQAEMVRSGAMTARALTVKTLRRIDRLDEAINAYRVVMAEHAIAEASRIDALPDHDRASLPLAGVPVAIKDDTDVEGQMTAWGSNVRRPPCERDADVVARLRRAGAVIIGKTNVPELTLWPWTASERWGVTSNPWDPGRTPGGSSGGSAAAVCTGMAAMALGSDGGGSIRYPAGLTGLVGVKPQRHRVPVGPEHHSGWNGLLVLGPLTRSVRDAALFLDVVSGEGDRTVFRDAVIARPERLRVAVSTNAPPGTQVSLSAARRSAVEIAASRVADLGHEVVEVDIDYGLASLWNSTVRLLKGVRDDAAFLDRGALERRTRAVARLGAMLPSRSLAHALRREEMIAASINAVLRQADLVLTPLCASPAPLLNECPSTGALRSLRKANTSAWLAPWNAIGQPAVAIPVGTDEQGLPTAVQLAGRAGDEATLLALAGELETNHPFPRWACRPTTSPPHCVRPPMRERRT